MSSPGRDLVRHRLNRAKECLEESEIMLLAGHENAAVNRLYYACFYAVLALLAASGMSSSKHSDVRSLFNQHFVKPGKVPLAFGKLFSELFDCRQESDYDDFYEAEPQVVAAWILQANQFVSEIGALAIPGAKQHQ